MLNPNIYKSRISLAVIWGVMFMAFPFSIFQAFALPSKAIISLGSIILIFFIAVFIKQVNINKNIVAIFFIQIIFAVVYIVIHKDLAYINLCFHLLIPLIIYVYINSVIDYKQLQYSMLNIMVVIGGLAVVCFLLCLLINLPEYSTFENPDGRTGYNYIISLTNTVFDLGFVKIIRPAGYFDEPGTLAFYLTVAILLNDLTVKKKWMRIVFITCGVFTLSVAFYLLMALYSLLYLSRRILFRGGIILCFALPLFLAVYSKLGIEQRDVIYSFTIGRLESLISSEKETEGYFQADNRSDLIDVSKDAIKDSPFIGQGLSYASIPGGKYNGKFMGANLLGVFGIHGIFGGIVFSLHVLHYFIICFRRKKWLDVTQKSSLIYLVLILQRPDYVGGLLTYVSVIMLTLASLNYQSNESKDLDYNRSL